MLFLTPLNPLCNIVKTKQYPGKKSFPSIDRKVRYVLARGLLFIVFIMLSALTGNAQNAPANVNGKISGRIIDSVTGQPVEFASISLALQTSDQEINGMMTDDKGTFVLTHVAAGTYKLRIFSIGYKSGIKNNIVVSKAKPNVMIGDIKLVNTTSKLSEVTVAAEKDVIENQVDKMVYNVDKDMTSQTGVAADVLKKIPEVEVDVDGNVELQGNSDIRFLIDGKPSTVFGNNLADVLQSIPASQIQSIEVITSPGAKYEAEGTAGIINIILKKSNAQGINGDLSLSGGTRLENGSFNLNARKGHFGAHIYVAGNGQLNSTTLNSITNTAKDTGYATSQLVQNGPSDFHRSGYQSGGGIDWDITKNNNISANVGYSYYDNSSTGEMNSQTIVRNELENVLSDINDLQATSSHFNQHNIDANLNYKRTFTKKDEELDMWVGTSSNTSSSNYTQTEEYPLNDYIYNGSYGDNPGTSKETHLSMDYSDPVGKGVTIQTGCMAVLDNITSTSDVYLLDPATDNYNYSITQSSSLIYKNNIYDGYFSGSGKLLKWLDMQMGARYEYTDVNAYYSNAGNVGIQPYGTFVPSVMFSHTFAKYQTLKISYTRRIQRPNYGNLNPFVNASNPQNITTGNPALQPEIGDKLELGYNKSLGKGRDIYLALFYRDNTHDIQPYTTYYSAYRVGDSTYDNTYVTVPSNIGHEINIGTNIYASIPVEKKLTFRTNIALFQRYINTGYSTGGDVSGFNYRLNLNTTYKFTKTLSAEVFANYNSARINAQGTYPSFFVYNFAIRKDILKDKGSIAITATNPFNYYVNQTTHLTGDDFTVVNTRALPYQSFGINFTYRFGKLEFKKEKETEDPNLNPQQEN